jgi:hypothetical protein
LGTDPKPEFFLNLQAKIMQKTSSHGPTYVHHLLWSSSSLGYLCGLHEEDFEVWAPKKKGGGDNVCYHWKHMRNTTNNNWELGGNKKGTYETHYYYWNPKFQKKSKKSL